MPTRKRGKETRSVFQRITSWPHLSAAIFTFALFVVISVTFRSIWFLGILSKDLTTTVTAATESLTLSLREKTQSSWVMPAGNYLVPEALKSIKTCAERPLLYGSIPQGFECTVSESVRLVVDGAADVYWEVTPDGVWSMLVGAADDTMFTASLFDVNDVAMLTTSEEIRFSTQLGSGPDTPVSAVRLPLIAATAVLGSHVHYASSIDGDTSDFWQPTLLAGSVVTFGRNHPDQGKYHILGEELDAGDVVSIDSAGRSEDESDSVAQDSIWGVATIEDRSVAVSGSTEVSQYLIHAVLHTTHRTLTVRRFGTADGHKIKASNWSIMQKWPNGQKTWVFWASVTGILAFAIQISDWIGSKATKPKKKK